MAADGYGFLLMLVRTDELTILTVGDSIAGKDLARTIIMVGRSPQALPAAEMDFG